MTITRIDFGFALGDTKATGRLIDTGGFKKKDRITHRIPISSLDAIDAEVKKWLRIAYDRDARVSKWPHGPTKSRSMANSSAVKSVILSLAPVPLILAKNQSRPVSPVKVSTASSSSTV